MIFSAVAFFNRSVAFGKAGMDDLAVADLEAALALRPKMEAALQNCALIMRRQV